MCLLLIGACICGFFKNGNSTCESSGSEQDHWEDQDYHSNVQMETLHGHFLPWQKCPIEANLLSVHCRVKCCGGRGQLGLTWGKWFKSSSSHNLISDWGPLCLLAPRTIVGPRILWPWCTKVFWIPVHVPPPLTCSPLAQSPPPYLAWWWVVLVVGRWGCSFCPGLLLMVMKVLVALTLERG